MQIFTANQRQWYGGSIHEQLATDYKSALIENSLKRVVAHNSYLINLGSPDPRKHAKSLQAFLEEYDRAELLNIPYIVFHPGAHMGKGEKSGLQKIAESLDQLFENRPEYKGILCLETTAGQGSTLGYTFEQLQQIITASRYSRRLGVCFDTCHVYAAGYDLDGPAGYIEVFKRFDEIIGLDRLLVFHLNDSKTGLGYRVDRHSVLGGGHLGWTFFHRLVCDRRFVDRPMILETPGGDERFAYEIAELKRIRDISGKQEHV
jgi:deoxyribonuclease-4